MKTRKLLALIMTIALALSLFACGASEAGKDTPPFSKVSLDCSEDDVVKAYGECSNISTNDQGGNVYTYLSDYTSALPTSPARTLQASCSARWTTPPTWSAALTSATTSSLHRCSSPPSA